MSEDSIKVVYSKKNILSFSYIIGLFALFDVFFIFVEQNFITSAIMVVLSTFYIFYFIYFYLNRINTLTFNGDTLFINRFLLNSLSFEVKNIKLVSKNILKIGKKSFNIRFVNNKNELITIILNGMGVKNIDEGVNGILSGINLYKNQEEINNANKRINKTITVYSIIMIGLLVLVGIGVIITAVENHWGIIYFICLVLFVIVCYLLVSIFEKKVNIDSKFLTKILKFSIYLISAFLTIVLGIIIYRVFMVWGIDLIKTTF